LGELIGIPAGPGIATVYVYRAEHAQTRGQGDFMGKIVPGQSGMVGLDVKHHLAREIEATQEGIDRCDIAIVLVLARFHRLRLDQDGSVETDTVLVLNDHGEEATGLFAFALEVGVEQAIVALASSPKYVIGAAETVGRLQRLLYLGRCI
jgi:hypothetical protein